MIQHLNNYAAVELIDNTNIDGFSGYAKGFSENHNLLDPSEARIISSPKYEPETIIQFINYQSWEHEGCHFIPSGSIFLSEGSLVKSGVVLKKTYVEQVDSGFRFRQQDFFQVVASNLEEIKQSDFVVTKSYTSFRFNHDGKEYFYASPSNIMIVITEDGIRPGPAYQFVEKDSGLIYAYSVFEIDISGQVYKIVPKATIYGEATLISKFYC